MAHPRHHERPATRDARGTPGAGTRRHRAQLAHDTPTGTAIEDREASSTWTRARGRSRALHGGHAHAYGGHRRRPCASAKYDGHRMPRASRLLQGQQPAASFSSSSAIRLLCGSGGDDSTPNAAAPRGPRRPADPADGTPRYAPEQSAAACRPGRPTHSAAHQVRRRPARRRRGRPRGRRQPRRRWSRLRRRAGRAAEGRDPIARRQLLDHDVQVLVAQARSARWTAQDSGPSPRPTPQGRQPSPP